MSIHPAAAEVILGSITARQSGRGEDINMLLKAYLAEQVSPTALWPRDMADACLQLYASTLALLEFELKTRAEAEGRSLMQVTQEILSTQVGTGRG